MSRTAVIVATARTPIGKAFRGAFNDTEGTTLAGHAVADRHQFGNGDQSRSCR